MLSHTQPKHPYCYYSIIRYRESLIGSSQLDIPIAVVVETKGHDAALMGYTPPEINNLSSISAAVISKLPQILIKQLEEAREQSKGRSVIDILSSNNRWNIYLTKPQKYETNHNLQETTLLLFARCVNNERLIGRTVEVPDIQNNYFIPPHSWSSSHHHVEMQGAD